MAVCHTYMKELFNLASRYFIFLTQKGIHGSPVTEDKIKLKFYAKKKKGGGGTTTTTDDCKVIFK